MPTRYLSAESLRADDFEACFTRKAGEFVYDTKTKYGPWATMTHQSFLQHGEGLVGPGYGQRYVRQLNGELHKDLG